MMSSFWLLSLIFLANFTIALLEVAAASWAYYLYIFTTLSLVWFCSSIDPASLSQFDITPTQLVNVGA